jgi:RND superfamily putative drug exporter
VHALRIPFVSLAPRAGFWNRMALGVMRRPLFVLVPTLAALLLMGVPFLHLRLAAADVSVLSADVEARRTFEDLRKYFPDQSATRVEIAVRFPGSPLTPERVEALYDFSRKVAGIPHVAKVQSIVDLPSDPPLELHDYVDILTNPQPMYAAQLDVAKGLFVKDDVTVVHALLDVPAEDDAARAVVWKLRADRRAGDGTFVVGGETATDVDSTEYMVSRTPRAVALVVGVTLVVLFLLLGSVVLPIKAVVMNFVSVAGSFGALVWVFQDGHLLVREPRPIEPTLPVLLFCILFGLSMDYEVLMLSRIKESYERSGDNTQAVAEGLEKTAGLITSAAAIMVAVFGAFALASVVLIRAVGFGMALAVALDATLVRVLLVPATMRLFGDANWWAPRPLLALRAALGFGKGGR